MCPHEVEVKSAVLMDADPVKGKDAVESALSSLISKGATIKGTKDQTDIYLSHPSRDLSTTDESLRVRGERALAPQGDGVLRTLLTYKGPKVSALTKTRYERELPLVDGIGPDDAEDLFLRLGFERAMVVRKRRTVLELDDIEVSLDLVEGLGAFIELELVSDDLEGSERRLMALLSKLGLKGTERRSYLELLIEKGLNR